MLHIVLSWLSILGVHIRIGFISRIVEPMFDNIAKYLPTRFLSIDISPLILILAITLVKGLILTVFPETQVFLHSFL